MAEQAASVALLAFNSNVAKITADVAEAGTELLVPLFKSVAMLAASAPSMLSPTANPKLVEG